MEADALRWWETIGLADILIVSILSIIAHQYKSFNSQNVNSLNSHIDDINSFRDLAAEYWSLDNREKNKVLQARILGAQENIVEFRNYALKIFQYDFEIYNDLLLELVSDCTGGDFGSANHGGDPSRVIRIFEKSRNIKDFLRAQRQAELSLFKHLSRLWSRYVQFWTPT